MKQSKRKQKRKDRQNGLDRSDCGLGHMQLGTQFHKRKDKCPHLRRRDKSYKEQE